MEIKKDGQVLGTSHQNRHDRFPQTYLRVTDFKKFVPEIYPKSGDFFGLPKKNLAALEIKLLHLEKLNLQVAILPPTLQCSVQAVMSHCLEIVLVGTDWLV